MTMLLLTKVIDTSFLNHLNEAVSTLSKKLDQLQWPGLMYVNRELMYYARTSSTNINIHHSISYFQPKHYQIPFKWQI